MWFCCIVNLLNTAVDLTRRSALMLACESDSIETVEALLRGGANTQLVDALGHRATDYSVTTGNQRVTQMLQDGPPPGTVWDLKSFFHFERLRISQGLPEESLSILSYHYKSSPVSFVKSGRINETAHDSRFYNMKWRRHMKHVAATSNRLSNPAYGFCLCAALLWILAVSLLPRKATVIGGSRSGRQLGVIAIKVGF